MGPMAVLDMIGMKTAYDVQKYWGEKLNDPNKMANAEMIKSEFIDKGNLGMSTGKGFYEYPNPSYAAEDFLK
jgi:3-hydroxybutyryl-CoA dehydrogenase